MRFLLLIVYIKCVLSEESDSHVKGQYSFNHPPSIEEYNPIPVSVVYEEDVSLKNVGPEKVTLIETSFTTGDDIKVTTEKVANTISSANGEQAKVTPKPRALGEIQIPVQVIYDTETDNIKNQTTSTSRPLRRRLKQRRQRPNTVKKEQVTEKTLTDIPQITESYRSSTKPQVSEVPAGIKARKRERDPIVPILESENNVYSHNGNFRYSYEGGDGTKAFSEGQLKTIDKEAGESVVGGFSYTDKDGNDFSVSYIADENGYRPVGAHLPTPPPIPPEIACALQYLATATTPKAVTKPNH